MLFGVKNIKNLVSKIKITLLVGGRTMISIWEKGKMDVF